jgi:hypothetical protein
MSRSRRKSLRRSARAVRRSEPRNRSPQILLMSRVSILTAHRRFC